MYPVIALFECCVRDDLDFVVGIAETRQWDSISFLCPPNYNPASKVLAWLTMRSTNKIKGKQL